MESSDRKICICVVFALSAGYSTGRDKEESGQRRKDKRAEDWGVRGGGDSWWQLGGGGLHFVLLQPGGDLQCIAIPSNYALAAERAPNALREEDGMLREEQICP